MPTLQHGPCQKRVFGAELQSLCIHLVAAS